MEFQGVPKIGDRIDVGGYSLWMQRSGEGSPTVVFESGLGDDASRWDGFIMTGPGVKDGGHWDSNAKQGN